MNKGRPSGLQINYIWFCLLTLYKSFLWLYVAIWGISRRLSDHVESAEAGTMLQCGFLIQTHNAGRRSYRRFVIRFWIIQNKSYNYIPNGSSGPEVAIDVQRDPLHSSPPSKRRDKVSLDDRIVILFIVWLIVEKLRLIPNDGAHADAQRCSYQIRRSLSTPVSGTVKHCR